MSLIIAKRMKASAVRAILEVLGQPSAAAEPSQSALDDPAFGKDLEARHVGASDDLEVPGAERLDTGRRGRALIGTVGDDALKEAKLATQAAKHRQSTVAILDLGRMNDRARRPHANILRTVPIQ